MRKTFYCISIFWISLFNSTNAQTIKFQQQYQLFNYGNFSISHQQASDGGYIITGNLSNPSLLKTDAQGIVQWAKEYAYPSGQIGATNEVQLANDGGYIISGTLFIPPSLFYNVIKTDANGNIQWNKQYGPPINCVLQQVIYAVAYPGYKRIRVKETDDGYVFMGEINDTAMHQNAFQLIKTDTSGQVQWSKHYDQNEKNGSYYDLEIVRSPDLKSLSGYIVCGRFIDTADNMYDKLLLTRIDNNGNIVWSSGYHSSNALEEPAYSIKQTNDYGFIVSYRPKYTWSPQIGAMKVDSLGIIQWAYNYNSPSDSWGNCVKQTFDGGYVIGGIVYYGGNSASILLKTDVNGNITWGKSYFADSYTSAISVVQTSDSGYSFCGGAANSGSDKMYLVKTDNLGNSGCFDSTFNVKQHSIVMQRTTFGLAVTVSVVDSAHVPSIQNNSITTITLCLENAINNISEDRDIGIFPNPFQDKITLLFPKKQNEKTELKIFNSIGELVFQKEIKFENQTLNLSYLRSGIYFLSVQINKNIFTEKIVKM